MRPLRRFNNCVSQLRLIGFESDAAAGSFLKIGRRPDQWLGSLLRAVTGTATV